MGNYERHVAGTIPSFDFRQLMTGMNVSGTLRKQFQQRASSKAQQPRFKRTLLYQQRHMQGRLQPLSHTILPVSPWSQLPQSSAVEERQTPASLSKHCMFFSPIVVPISYKRVLFFSRRYSMWLLCTEDTSKHYNYSWISDALIKRWIPTRRRIAGIKLLWRAHCFCTGQNHSAIGGRLQTARACRLSRDDCTCDKSIIVQSTWVSHLTKHLLIALGSQEHSSSHQNCNLRSWLRLISQLLSHQRARKAPSPKSESTPTSASDYGSSLPPGMGEAGQFCILICKLTPINLLFCKIEHLEQALAF